MSDQARSLDDCFAQGVDARQQGRKVADNPYHIETEEHREWAAGWAATLDLDEDDDPASTRIDTGSEEAGGIADGAKAHRRARDDD